MTERKPYTVPEAARLLGVGTDAIRKRVARGTIPSELIEGRRYVYLDAGHDTGQAAVVPELVDELRARIADLKEQLDEAHERDRENRRIIADLAARIPGAGRRPHSAPHGGDAC